MESPQPSRPLQVKLAVAYLGLSVASRTFGLLTDIEGLGRVIVAGKTWIIGVELALVLLGFVSIFLMMDRKPLAHAVGLVALLAIYQEHAVLAYRQLRAGVEAMNAGRLAEGPLVWAGFYEVVYFLAFWWLWLTFAFSASTRAYFRSRPQVRQPAAS